MLFIPFEPQSLASEVQRYSLTIQQQNSLHLQQSSQKLLNSQQLHERRQLELQQGLQEQQMENAGLLEKLQTLQHATKHSHNTMDENIGQFRALISNKDQQIVTLQETVRSECEERSNLLKLMGRLQIDEVEEKQLNSSLMLSTAAISGISATTAITPSHSPTYDIKSHLQLAFEAMASNAASKKTKQIRSIARNWRFLLNSHK